ncbi:MAG: hypothetical protein ACK5Q3_08340 [Planctomycetota bacterium]|jgi:hypothetical protein
MNKQINVDFRPMDNNAVGLFDELARMILLNESNPFVAMLIDRKQKDHLVLIGATILASFAIENPDKSKSILGFSVQSPESSLGFSDVLGRMLSQIQQAKCDGGSK